MRVSVIVTRVRAAIDELMQNDSAFLRVSEDEKNLTDVIIDKIGYALQHVIDNAPLEKLDSSMFEELTAQELQDSFSIDSELVGRLTLPTDTLRIIEARLSSWSLFPLPVSPSSQVYLMQQDKYARGSWDRPVNVLTAGVLEMYCAKTNADTLIFKFIRKPVVAAPSQLLPDPDVSVPAQLEAALIYQIAGMAMVAFREDIAATLFALASRYTDPRQTNDTGT